MSTSSGQNASDPANTLDLSFSYTLPSDWEAFDDRQSLLAVQQQTEKSGATVEARRGINCTRKLMTSRHGKPYSVVSVSALPFACFGHEMPASDLPAFASGGWDNLKSEFDMSEMFWTDYSLGSHAVRAQRANGNIKGHPEIHYRIELVCTVLKKAAVCWTGLSTDDAAQRAFEQSTPKLDSDPATELVPENGVEWKMQL
jgi:hypothetical protein